MIDITIYRLFDAVLIFGLNFSGVYEMRYNPALDGLRAIAIALVLACHTQLLRGGWVGVDVFFVLSGYLITSILLNELRQTGRISFANFYWRRSLRLLPALAVLVTFMLVRSVLSPNGGEIRAATLIGAAYLENWNNVYSFGPFDLMGHTWSLATEEQFYILWPLLLPLVFLYRPMAWIGIALGAMIAAHFLGYSYATVQYSLFIRPVGLVIGCMLAFMQTQRWKLPTAIAPTLLLTLVVIAACANRISPAAPMIASIAAAGMIVCLQRPGLLTSALATMPVRYIGKISYGLYLYHWPIFILGEKWKFHTPFHLYAAGLLAVIFVAAALSYELVEKPFLRLKDHRMVIFGERRVSPAS